MTAPTPPVEESAEGAWVTTVEGRRLLNCGGYGVLTFGAGHPRVVDRVRRQLDRLAFGSRTLPHAEERAAADAVRTVLPGELSDVAFCTTGSEAVEMALRLARLNRCTRMITTTGGFHGRTLGSLSVNGTPLLRRPYRPLLEGVRTVDYGDAALVRRALAEEPGRAVVIVEPVQGESGVRVPPPEYLAEVAEACAEHRALLVVDEVQTGLGRLGHRWGVDRSGVVPDVLVMGKALGGGVLPASGIAVREEAYRPFRRDPRQASATFSGAPLLMAAVQAAVEVFCDEKVVERARAAEPLIAECLGGAADRADGLIREVRGLGVLHGVEFAHPKHAAAFAAALIEHGVVPSHSMATTATVRLTPSALVSETDLEHLASAVAAATETTLAAA
ncbi:aspartate aminotransferase family protein [Nocardiopsis halotolerans]|uniref:aspartate aminotransferase family protein n=1 Tax=Nocardiopsis halotolerans TaxID=124252 RepID=UPI0003483049|nr:aspartate aminotransferase family protein [Nocardiopsis halotolerans]